MRYIHKFVHGVHVIFDCEKYENILLFNLKRDCLEAVKRLNQQASR